MFNITVFIDGLYKTPDDEAHCPHSAEEILKMVRVFKKPSMFGKMSWSIFDTDTDELLAAWSPDMKKEFIAPAIAGF